jgi:hypothetical protein
MKSLTVMSIRFTFPVRYGQIRRFGRLIGLVMAINFATAPPHLVRVRENAIEASEHAAKDPPAPPALPED